MNISSSKYAKIAFVVGMVVIVAAFAAIIPGTPQTPAPQNTTSGTVPAAATTTSSSTGATGTGSGTATAQPKTSGSGTAKVVTTSSPNKPFVLEISFVTPVSSDFWTIASQNLISWNNAGNVSGELTLVNAQTKKLVGVILNQVGPQQTSYTWNTRDLLVSRTSPAKITVAPGMYMIVLSYDGNNITPATSPAFNIVQ